MPHPLVPCHFRMCIIPGRNRARPEPERTASARGGAALCGRCVSLARQYGPLRWSSGGTGSAMHCKRLHSVGRLDSVSQLSRFGYRIRSRSARDKTASPWVHIQSASPRLLRTTVAAPGPVTTLHSSFAAAAAEPTDGGQRSDVDVCLHPVDQEAKAPHGVAMGCSAAFVIVP